ncbi:hypothetical protein CFT12S00416_07995 [Campylobacter fetus subsp. testudinum]|uniref:hypothetical protein n=1 Tax=Campylobacter fetus TaxID=196 RepID=UPI0008189FEA|nr:hypothetical protein [Campylobacter fetus]OCR87757.1 hypothetical protein CFT12S00416_07995 [Campylobacter fetus subsp. testudinum]
MKKMIILASLLAAIFAFGAGEFDAVNGVVENLDKQVSQTSGLFLKTVMAWLPLILLVGGIFAGYKHTKKQADQEQDSWKVYLTVGGVGVAGAILGIAIDALIGAGLMNDAMKGVKVLTDYWINALS